MSFNWIFRIPSPRDNILTGPATPWILGARCRSNRSNLHRLWKYLNSLFAVSPGTAINTNNTFLKAIYEPSPYYYYYIDNSVVVGRYYLILYTVGSPPCNEGPREKKVRHHVESAAVRRKSSSRGHEPAKFLLSRDLRESEKMTASVAPYQNSAIMTYKHTPERYRVIIVCITLIIGAVLKIQL